MFVFWYFFRCTRSLSHATPPLRCCKALSGAGYISAPFSIVSLLTFIWSPDHAWGCVSPRPTLCRFLVIFLVSNVSLSLFATPPLRCCKALSGAGYISAPFAIYRLLTFIWPPDHAWGCVSPRPTLCRFLVIFWGGWGFAWRPRFLWGTRFLWRQSGCSAPEIAGWSAGHVLGLVREWIT